MPGARKALLIACDKFDDIGFPLLKAPISETRALAELLANPNIGNFKVETLFNRTGREIAKAIRSLCQEASSTDLLLLYFAGHGALDEDRKFYFVATDTESDHLSISGVKDEVINRAIQDSPCKKKILILDCCYSGAFANNIFARSNETVGLATKLASKGTVLLTASDSLEYAYERQIHGEQLPKSIFTSRLLDGLRTGEADGDEDGEISTDDLYEYARTRIRQEDNRQKPLKASLADGLIIIASAAAQKKVREDHKNVEAQKRASESVASLAGHHGAAEKKSKEQYKPAFTHNKDAEAKAAIKHGRGTFITMLVVLCITGLAVGWWRDKEQPKLYQQQEEGAQKKEKQKDHEVEKPKTDETVAIKQAALEAEKQKENDLANSDEAAVTTQLAEVEKQREKDLVKSKADEATNKAAGTYHNISSGEANRLETARMLTDEGKKIEAHKQYELLAKETDNPDIRIEALVKASLLKIDLGQYANAIVDLHKALQQPEIGLWKETALTALLATASILTDQGQKTEAHKQYELLAMETDNSEMRVEILVKASLLKIDLDQSANAITDLQKALQQPEIGSWKETALTGLVHALFKCSKFNQLVDIYKANIKEFTSKTLPEVLFLTAIASREISNYKDSLQFYQQIIKDYPDSRYAKQAREGAAEVTELAEK